MSPQAIPYVIILSLIYSSTLISGRYIVGQLEFTTFIGLRLMIAAVAFLFIYTFSIAGHGFPKDKRVWKHGAVLGVFGTAIPMNLITASLLFQSSGVTALLLTTGPAIVVVLAHFFLADERLNLKKIIGVLLALAGAILLITLGETGLPDVANANPIGYYLVLGAMVSGGGAAIYTRLYMQRLHPLDVSGVRTFVAAVVVMPISLLLVGFDVSALSTIGWTALAWAGIIGTFISILMAFWVNQKFGATTQAMPTYLMPIFSGILGVLLLDETITLGMMGGMAVILLGLATINESPRKTMADTPGTD